MPYTPSQIIEKSSASSKAAAYEKLSLSSQMIELQATLEKAGKKALIDRLIKIRNLQYRLSSQNESLTQIIQSMTDKDTAFGPAGITEDSYNRVMSSIKFSSLNNNVGAMGFLYPTFKVYFIEDDGEFVYFSNDMYAYNAVKMIDVYEDEDLPTITLKLILSNMYGNLTNIFADQLNLENPFQVGPNDSEAINSTLIKPGCKIQVRMGYASILNADDIVFNGEISSVSGEEEVTIVATSYSSILNKPIGEGAGKDLGGVMTMMTNMTGLGQIAALGEGIFNYNTSKVQNLILQLLKEAGGLGRLGGVKLSLVDMIQPLNKTPLLFSNLSERFKAGLEKTLKGIHGGNYLDTLMINVNITDKKYFDDFAGGFGSGYSKYFGKGIDNFSGSWFIQNETVWDALNDLMLQESNYGMLIRNLDAGNTLVIDELDTGYYLYSTKNGTGLLRYGALIRLIRKALFNPQQTYRIFREISNIISKQDDTTKSQFARVISGILRRIATASSSIDPSATYSSKSATIDQQVQSSIIAQLNNPRDNPIGTTYVDSFLQYDAQSGVISMMATTDNRARQAMRKFIDGRTISDTPTTKPLLSQGNVNTKDAERELATAVTMMGTQPLDSKGNKITTKDGKELKLGYNVLFDGFSFDGYPVTQFPPMESSADTKPVEYDDKGNLKYKPGPVEGLMGLKVCEYFLRAFLNDIMLKSGCYRQISVMHYKDSADHIIRNTIHTVQGPNRVVMDLVDPGTPLDAAAGIAVSLLPAFLQKMVSGGGFTIAGLNNANNRASVDVTVSPEIREDAIRVYTTFQKNAAAREAFFGGGRSRYLVANNVLNNVVQNWYDGQLIILGDQKIRAGDRVTIYDQITDMFGTVKVRQVHHSIDMQQGFITTITPRLITKVVFDIGSIGSNMQILFNVLNIGGEVLGVFMMGGTLKWGIGGITKLAQSGRGIASILKAAGKPGADAVGLLGRVGGGVETLCTSAGPRAADDVIALLRNPAKIKEFDDAVIKAVKAAQESFPGQSANVHLTTAMTALEQQFGAQTAETALLRAMTGGASGTSKVTLEHGVLLFKEGQHEFLSKLGIVVKEGDEFTIKTLSHTSDAIEDVARGLNATTYTEITSKLAGATPTTVKELVASLKSGIDARIKTGVNADYGGILSNLVSGVTNLGKVKSLFSDRTLLKTFLKKASFTTLGLGIYSKLSDWFNPMAGIVLDVGNFFGTTPISMYPVMQKGQALVANMDGVTKLRISRNGGIELGARITTKWKEFNDNINDAIRSFKDLKEQWQQLLVVQAGTRTSAIKTEYYWKSLAVKTNSTLLPESLQFNIPILTTTASLQNGDYGFLNTSVMSTGALKYLENDVYAKMIDTPNDPYTIEGRIYSGIDGLWQIMQQISAKYRGDKIVGDKATKDPSKMLVPVIEFAFVLMPEFFRYIESVIQETGVTSRINIFTNSSFLYMSAFDGRTNNSGTITKEQFWDLVYTKALADKSNWALSPNMLLSLKSYANANTKGLGKVYIAMPGMIGENNLSTPQSLRVTLPASTAEADLLKALLDLCGIDRTVVLNAREFVINGGSRKPFNRDNAIAIGSTNEFIGFVMQQDLFTSVNGPFTDPTNFFKTLWSGLINPGTMNQYPYIRIRLPYSAVPYVTQLDGINGTKRINPDKKGTVPSYQYQVLDFVSSKPVGSSMSTVGHTAQQNYYLPVDGHGSDLLNFPAGLDPAFYDPWANEFENLWFVPGQYTDDGFIPTTTTIAQSTGVDGKGQEIIVTSTDKRPIYFRINPFLIDGHFDVPSVTEKYFDNRFRNNNVRVKITIPSANMFAEQTLICLNKVNAIISYSNNGGLNWTSINEEVIKKFYATVGYFGVNSFLLSDPVNFAQYRSLKADYTTKLYSNLVQAGSYWNLPFLKLNSSYDITATADKDIFDYKYEMTKVRTGEVSEYLAFNGINEIVKDGDAFVLSPINKDTTPSVDGDLGFAYKTFRAMGINSHESNTNQYLGNEARMLTTFLLALTNHDQIGQISSVDINVYEIDSAQGPSSPHTPHLLSSTYAVRNVIDPALNAGGTDFKNGFVIYRTKVNLGANRTDPKFNAINVEQVTAGTDFGTYGRILRFHTLPFKVRISKVPVGQAPTEILVEDNLSKILLWLGLAVPYLSKADNIITHARTSEFGTFHLNKGQGMGIYSVHKTLKEMLRQLNNSMQTQQTQPAELARLMRNELSYYSGHEITLLRQQDNVQ